MKNTTLLLATIIGTLVMVFGIAALFSDRTTPSQSVEVYDQDEIMSGARNIRGDEVVTATPSTTPTPAADPDATSAATASDSAKIPVTIVEFSDFQCPACRVAQPLVEGILEQYPGQVRLVYRHFPLDEIHPNARLAAQGAEVAADNGKFWEYHDLLFEKQDEWAPLTDRNQLKEKLAEYAVQLQIDKTKFLETIESDTIASRVAADVTAGHQFKVEYTPTFYVNGVKMTAPQLQATVESLVTPAPAQ